MKETEYLTVLARNLEEPEHELKKAETVKMGINL